VGPAIGRRLWTKVATASLSTARGTGSAAPGAADAAMRGDIAMPRSLLAQHVDGNAAQPDGATALHWAAHYGDVEAARALLDAGADAEAVTRAGVPPLALASINGNSALVGLLLDAG